MAKKRYANRPNVYETAVIYSPVLEEKDVEAEIEKVKGMLESFGATIDKIDIWGRRRLEYEIKKRREGVYVFFYYKLIPVNNPLAKLERALRINEGVLRTLTIHRDDAYKKSKKRVRPPRGEKKSAPIDPALAMAAEAEAEEALAAE